MFSQPTISGVIVDIQVEQHPNQRAVVKVSGRLDMESAQALKLSLKQAAAEGLVRLVVDLEGVSFIDSSGLSALVSGLKAAREGGGMLVLTGVGPQVKVALELTRLNRVFAVYHNSASALASFEK